MGRRIYAYDVKGVLHCPNAILVRNRECPPATWWRPGRIMRSCCGESASHFCGICATARNPGSNMVRLVHVTTVPESLTFFQGQVGYLKARGVDVWALSSPGELLDQFAAREGVPVHGLEMPRRITPLRDLATTARLWRWLRKVRPDIVNAHTPKGGLLGMVGAWLARVPVRVYHMHGLPLMTATGLKRRLLRWAEKVSCLLAHQVFCVSASLREAAVAEGLCRPDKITVLHHGSINGVAAETAFNPARVGGMVRAAARGRYGIPLDAEVIGFVGRVVRDKGLVELVEAWQTLRAERPELHLLVVGPFEPQDPLPPEVEKLLRTDPRVHLTGIELGHAAVVHGDGRGCAADVPRRVRHRRHRGCRDGAARGRHRSARLRGRRSGQRDGNAGATARRGRADGGDPPLPARPGAAASARPGRAGMGAAGVSAGGHLGSASTRSTRASYKCASARVDS